MIFCFTTVEEALLAHIKVETFQTTIAEKIIEINYDYQILHG